MQRACKGDALFTGAEKGYVCPVASRRRRCKISASSAPEWRWYLWKCDVLLSSSSWLLGVASGNCFRRAIGILDMGFPTTVRAACSSATCASTVVRALRYSVCFSPSMRLRRRYWDE